MSVNNLPQAVLNSSKLSEVLSVISIRIIGIFLGPAVDVAAHEASLVKFEASGYEKYLKQQRHAETLEIVKVSTQKL